MELTASRVFSSYGVPIGVRTNDASLLDRVPDSLPPGWSESPSSEAAVWYSLVTTSAVGGGRVRYELFEGQQAIESAYRLQRILERLDSAIRLQIGKRSTQRLFVHAGAVAWGRRAIVIPGRSGTGKTSLVEALVKAGATYCSDEYALLDAEGLLHPYARPLSVRQGVHRRIKRCAVADLGGENLTEALPIGIVLRTQFRPGAVWAPRVVSSGEGALALFDNTLAARERPEFAFRVLSRAILGVVTVDTDRGDAEEVAPAVLDYLETIQFSTWGAE